MRVPKIERYIEPKEVEYINLPTIEFTKPHYVFFTPKDRVKFVKRVESICRGSFEYKEFVGYLVDNIGMNFCSAFNNISKDTIKKIGIEIHHEPFTLFDIVNIVVEKWLQLEKPLDPIGISEEVMRLHYEGKIGLIPLSLTVHELVHAGRVFIPLQSLDNGFMKFFEEYKQYIPEQIRDILKIKINLSKKFVMEDNAVLKRKYVYINNEGYNSTPERLE